MLLTRHGPFTRLPCHTFFFLGSSPWWWAIYILASLGGAALVLLLIMVTTKSFRYLASRNAQRLRNNTEDHDDFLWDNNDLQYLPLTTTKSGDEESVLAVENPVVVDESEEVIQETNVDDVENRGVRWSEVRIQDDVDRIDEIDETASNVNEENEGGLGKVGSGKKSSDHACKQKDKRSFWKKMLRRKKKEHVQASTPTFGFGINDESL